jgi:putative ABC transport system permease protein
VASAGSTSSTITLGWGLAVTLGVLVLVAVVVSALGRLGVGRPVLTAVGRAVLQLAVVSTVIVEVARSMWLTWLFVLIMFGAATVTSARRLSSERTGLRAALPIAAAALPVLAVVLACRAVPWTGIAVIPVAGIVLGGAMTTTSLAGRRALDELANRYPEYEAWLALGMPEREAALLFCRPAGVTALVPPLDQTRTVGLVTLPGAFVGVLLGSGNAAQAGAAQLLVLVGLLAAECIAVMVTVELVARGAIRRPTERAAQPWRV